MAHQCLKCGRSYPDGSPQILKGCEGCKGTRFFYTERPISDDERHELAERTQDELGGDAPARQRRIPTKAELPVGSDRDWVSLGPGNLRTIVEDVVRRAHEKKPSFRVGAGGEGAPSLQEWVRERERELSYGERRPDEPRPASEPREPGGDASDSEADEAWPPWPSAKDPSRDASDKRPPGQPESAAPAQDGEAVVYRRSRRAPVESEPGPVEPEREPVEPEPGPVEQAAWRDEAVPSDSPPATVAWDEQAPVSAPVEAAGDSEAGRAVEADDGSLYPEGQRPETVEVLEQGVYDLDVQRLLEKSPIVVHKDGSYSLHLPSLMESIGAKRR